MHNLSLFIFVAPLLISGQIDSDSATVGSHLFMPFPNPLFESSVLIAWDGLVAFENQISTPRLDNSSVISLSYPRQKKKERRKELS